MADGLLSRAVAAWKETPPGSVMVISNETGGTMFLCHQEWWTCEECLRAFGRHFAAEFQHELWWARSRQLGWYQQQLGARCTVDIAARVHAYVLEACITEMELASVRPAAEDPALEALGDVDLSQIPVWRPRARAVLLCVAVVVLVAIAVWRFR